MSEISVAITARTLPEAWEKVLMGIWMDGLDIKTQYDRSGDPPSKDAFTVMAVTEPLAEPRVHLCFPGGPTELKEYELEVTEGVHDHWIGVNATSWQYTYHKRLTAYAGLYDQIDDYIIPLLSKCPYSRRAVAITWIPGTDDTIDDPPCLQQVWARMYRQGDVYKLCMNTLWRSRDWFKAAYMNAWAFIELQKRMVCRINERRKAMYDSGELDENIPVEVGVYRDVSWSSHIYGSDFVDSESTMSMQWFLRSIKSRPFRDRVADSTKEPWPEMFELASEKARADKRLLVIPSEK